MAKRPLTNIPSLTFIDEELPMLRNLIIASLLFFVAASGAAAHGGKHMLKALDLTDAQKAKIKEQRAAHKAKRESFREKMKAIKVSKRELIENYSDEKANSLADDVAAMARQKVLNKIEMHKAVYDILDDQQKKKYLSLLTEKGEKRGKDWLKDRGVFQHEKHLDGEHGDCN